MTDELLIKFLLKESTPAEDTLVNEWLNAATANQDYFAQLQKIWEVSKNLDPKSKVDEEEAWTKFKRRTVIQSKAPKATLNHYWLKIAAVLVIAFGAWSVYRVLGPNAYQELSASDQVLVQQLPDGSALTLNKFSHVSYARNFKNNRSVHLQSGDVFFNVAKDKNKPFIIEVDKVSVEVVGTSFNVKHQKDETEINVETGIVKVKLNKQEIELYKGEKITINSATAQLSKQAYQDQLYNYYHSRMFMANNTPLWKLVATLNEAYGSKIKVDKAVKDLTFTAPLKFESLNHNLEIICQTLELKAVSNQNEILLSHKK